jgi:hypothetical protein
MYHRERLANGLAFAALSLIGTEMSVYLALKSVKVVILVL